MDVFFGWWMLIGCIVVLVMVLDDEEARDPAEFTASALAVVMLVVAILWPAVILVWLDELTGGVGYDEC